MITLKQKGDFSKTFAKLEKIKHAFDKSIFDEYGRRGVEALAAATPVRTGKTASSWDYSVIMDASGVSIQYSNSNIQNGVPIAIILQYGHGTNGGGYVQGRDYINPAIRPVFDSMANQLWKEVSG